MSAFRGEKIVLILRLGKELHLLLMPELGNTS